MWKYRTETVRDQYGLPDAKLNELGQEGWELVSVVSTPSFYKYIFKKPILDLTD